MDINKSIKLIEQYSICPECSNDKVANGAGKLEIDNYTFYRSCKCGWSVKINLPVNK